MKNLSSLKRLSALFALLLTISFISVIFISAPITASAQTSLGQCNGTDNVGGQAVECHYTVTNNLNGDVTSSTTTLEECHGFANDPSTLVCSSSTVSSNELVTAIDQCNGSGSGGGGTVLCTVDVINNITAIVTPTSATVNQCNSSGTGGGTEPTILCDPYPANTTSATVTQCNGSGNEGGGTTRVRCEVGSSSTTTSLLPVTVNQCNGSGNGGGATVTCRVSLTDVITEPVDEPTDNPSPGPTDNPGPDNPGPDNPGPDSPGPDSPGPDSPGPDSPGPSIDTGTSGSPGTNTSLTTGQISRIPEGGAAAGGGSTSGVENMSLLLIGTMLLAAAGAAGVLRRRFDVKA